MAEIPQHIKDAVADMSDEIVLARALHNAAVAGVDPEARRRFTAAVRHVLGTARSTLDYLAVALVEHYGDAPKSDDAYYPFTSSASDFEAQIENKMPGVPAACPHAVAKIKEFQRYQPGMRWLADLNGLRNRHTHRGPTWQLVRATYTVGIVEKSTGSVVEWHDLYFDSRTRGSDLEGHVAMRLSKGRDVSAVLARKGDTWHVFGVPIDVRTQLPRDTRLIDGKWVRFEQMFFVALDRPVLDVLNEVLFRLPPALLQIWEAAAGPAASA